jgi:hypothetical protein
MELGHRCPEGQTEIEITLTKPDADLHGKEKTEEMTEHVGH